MDTGVKAKILHVAVSELAARGLDYDFVTDAEIARPRLARLPKQQSMYPLNIAENDFLRTKTAWIFFTKDGRDIGVGAAKLEEFGGEDIFEYWHRVAARIYQGANLGVKPIGLSGNVIHVGDMYVEREWREPAGHIRAMLFTMYALASFHWPEANAIYAFIRERNMMRGSAVEYCATRQAPVPGVWEDSVNEPLWVVFLTIGELEYISRSFLRFPETFSSYKTHLIKSAPQS
jgi:hypothetical protein